MTTFTTYLDVSRDSDTKVDSGVYSLAGYISDSNSWAAFDRDWLAVLNEFRIPAFHMTDFEGWDNSRNQGFGVFKDWQKGDPRRLPLLTKLLAAIEKHTVGSISYAVSQSVYDRVVPEEVKSAVQSPYFFLFLNLTISGQKLMDDAMRYGKMGVPDDWTMRYLLARGDEGSQKVVEIWMSKAAGAGEARIDLNMEGVGIVQDNSKFPALQAADILAYESRKQVGQQLGSHTRAPRRSFTAMESSKRPKIWEFYPDDIALRLNADTVHRVLTGDGKTEILRIDLP